MKNILITILAIIGLAIAFAFPWVIIGLFVIIFAIEACSPKQEGEQFMRAHRTSAEIRESIQGYADAEENMISEYKPTYTRYPH